MIFLVNNLIEINCMNHFTVIWQKRDALSFRKLMQNKQTSSNSVYSLKEYFLNYY